MDIHISDRERRARVDVVFERLQLRAAEARSLRAEIDDARAEIIQILRDAELEAAEASGAIRQGRLIEELNRAERWRFIEMFEAAVYGGEFSPWPTRAWQRLLPHLRFIFLLVAGLGAYSYVARVVAGLVVHVATRAVQEILVLAFTAALLWIAGEWVEFRARRRDGYLRGRLIDRFRT